jgi:hypothetical protein
MKKFQKKSFGNRQGASKRTLAGPGLETTPCSHLALPMSNSANGAKLTETFTHPPRGIQVDEEASRPAWKSTGSVVFDATQLNTTIHRPSNPPTGPSFEQRRHHPPPPPSQSLIRLTTNLRRRLPLQYNRHSTVRSSIVRVPQQTPKSFLAMRLRPKRSPHTSVRALAREKQNPAPEDEPSSGVRRVGVGDETRLVEMARLRVDVEERVGPVGR